MSETINDNAIDEPITVTGSEAYWEYIDRLAESNRKRKESSDAVQAIIDADRARRGY